MSRIATEQPRAVWCCSSCGAIYHREGLSYAHDAGIVHRDLKPENILVAQGPGGPVPKLVDFGLALWSDQRDARLTESGMTMGTPLFAAPEQLTGKPIDHRADLFALGMTMFEMLTGGMTAVDGHLMEVISAKTRRDAPRVSERAPELAIPAELDDVVARLTRRKPEERFAHAREVIEALDRVAAVVVGEVVEPAAATERAGADPTEPDPETRIPTEQIVLPRRWPRRRRGCV